MSVYSDMKCANDEEEYLFLKQLARQEAESDNEETWDESGDEEEAFEDGFVWNVHDLCEEDYEDEEDEE